MINKTQEYYFISDYDDTERAYTYITDDKKKFTSILGMLARSAEAAGAYHQKGEAAIYEALQIIGGDWLASYHVGDQFDTFRDMAKRYGIEVENKETDASIRTWRAIKMEIARMIYQATRKSKEQKIYYNIDDLIGEAADRALDYAYQGEEALRSALWLIGGDELAQMANNEKITARIRRTSETFKSFIEDNRKNKKKALRPVATELLRKDIAVLAMAWMSDKYENEDEDEDNDSKSKAD